MNKFQTFQEFLATQSIQVPIWDFLINLIAAAILAYLLGLIYIRYGNALSNRRLFSRNFMLITMTTMVVITIVKSSLALSLGLVGALSIVRFRAAIKEPEELSYLFIAIVIGLGFGADQRIITFVAFTIIAVIIILKKRSHSSEENKNLFLAIYSPSPDKVGLDKLIEAISKNCSEVNLKRFEENNEMLEASFFVTFENFYQLNDAKNALQKLNDSIKVSFLDNSGLI